MFLRFAALSFLFGCSSPSYGAAAVLGASHDHDDSALKVNSPTVGASFSDTVVMDRKQKRDLKDGKKKKPNDQEDDHTNLFANGSAPKSPKAPSDEDQELRWFMLSAHLELGEFSSAFRAAGEIKQMYSEFKEAEVIKTMVAANDGITGTFTHQFATIFTMEEGNEGERRKKEEYMQRILEDFRKMYGEIEDTIESLIDNSSDDHKAAFYNILGNFYYADTFMSALAVKNLSAIYESATYLKALSFYKLAYSSGSSIDFVTHRYEAMLSQYNLLRAFQQEQDPELTDIVVAELNNYDLSFGLILNENGDNKNRKDVEQIRNQPLIMDNLEQVIEIGVCYHFATSTINLPCDDSCVAGAPGTGATDECCGLAYMIACAMIEEMGSDSVEGKDIEVHVALNSELSDGVTVSTTLHEVQMKIVTNDIPSGELPTPMDEQSVRELATAAVTSIEETFSTPASITLEENYVYDFSICQESSLESVSTSMVISLVGESPLIHDDLIYIAIGASATGGKVFVLFLLPPVYFILLSAFV